MKTDTSQTNIPQGWQENKLLDCLRVPSKLAGIKLSEYEKDGEFPVFDQGQDYISGYSSKKDLVVDNVPAILFGDHTRVVKYIKKPFVAGADGTKIFWAKDGFDPTFLYYLVLNQKIPNTGYNRHFKFFKDIKVVLPESKTEQKRIAEILGAVDEDIAKTQAIIEATEKLKRGLMQQLFTRGIGHAKFKKTKIGEIPENWKIENTGDLINVKHGFAFKGQYFTDQETENVLLTPANFKIGGGFNNKKFKYYEGNLPQDYILNEGDLLLTMTDLSKAGDTLGYPALIPENKKKKYLHNQRLGKVELKSNKVGLGFLYWRFMGEDYRKQILSTATGTTVRHTSPSKIQEFEFALPSMPEQEKIAKILSAVDEKISVNKKLKARLTHLKKGLMQDLLSGKVRTGI